MSTPDLSNTTSLELMRRIARRLPSNGREAIALYQVITGLSSPAFFAVVDGDVQRTTSIETARGLLTELLPRLQKILPDDSDVGELVARNRDGEI